MIEGHRFIFEKGIWLGEGVISINVTSEQVKYFTRWEFSAEENGVIEVIHQVEMQGVAEPTINRYKIEKEEKGKFLIEGENQNFGVAKGKGVFNEEHIAWEFVGNNLPFEGLEIFFKENEENYKTRAEFFTKDNLRTIIAGRVWRSVSQEEKTL